MTSIYSWQGQPHESRTITERARSFREKAKFPKQKRKLNIKQDSSLYDQDSGFEAQSFRTNKVLEHQIKQNLESKQLRPSSPLKLERKADLSVKVKNQNDQKKSQHSKNPSFRTKAYKNNEQSDKPKDERNTSSIDVRISNEKKSSKASDKQQKKELELKSIGSIKKQKTIQGTEKKGQRQEKQQERQQQGLKQEECEENKQQEYSLFDQKQKDHQFSQQLNELRKQSGQKLDESSNLIDQSFSKNENEEEYQSKWKQNKKDEDQNFSQEFELDGDKSFQYTEEDKVSQQQKKYQEKKKKLKEGKTKMGQSKITKNLDQFRVQFKQIQEVENQIQLQAQAKEFVKRIQRQKRQFDGKIYLLKRQQEQRKKINQQKKVDQRVEIIQINKIKRVKEIQRKLQSFKQRQLQRSQTLTSDKHRSISLSEKLSRLKLKLNNRNSEQELKNNLPSYTIGKRYLQESGRVKKRAQTQSAQYKDLNEEQMQQLKRIRQKISLLTKIVKK